MKFCPDCGNLLVRVTKTGDLKFHCNQCNKNYDSNLSDSLVYEENDMVGQTLETYRNLVRNAPHAPTIPRAEKKCKKCDAPEVSYIRVGADDRQLFICKCKHIWMAN